MCSLPSKISLGLLTIVLLNPLCGLAQDPQKDTGIIDRIVGGRDTLYAAPTDTATRKWSDMPIDSMLFRNNKSRFKKELYNLIIRDDRDTVKMPTENTLFAALDGRIIRSIEFRHVDMFAPSVSDTGYHPDSWFEKTANATHVDTRKAILERYLLMKPGDPLDVFLAAENERILRDLTFIMDARFIGRPVKGSPDSVDLVLITQDKFPIGLGAQLESSSLAVLGITHQNIMGYGHQFSVASYLDTKNSPHLGYQLSYGTTNIAGTFTSGKLEYLKKWDQETFLIDFSRDFRALSLESAGGFTFENTSITQHIHMLDTIFQLVEHQYSITDLWTGRIFVPVNQPGLYTRTGIYVSGRFTNYNSIVSPSIDDIYLYPFSDRVQALLSLGISSQGSRKDNLVYTFGRTEDVPFGYQFDITTGYEWQSNKERPYISFGASYGTYLKKSGHIFGQIQYGTFFYNGDPEQGVLRLRTSYFSHLHGKGRFQYRNFITLLYTKGFDRNPGEFVSLSNRMGIKGLASNSLRGNDKLVVNLETVLFSPYRLFGFRFAFFGGLDLGMIKRETERISDTRLFSGINLGIRIRNDQLVFNTFVVKFAVYPGRPSDATAENFTIDQVPRIRFNDFLPDKPDFVPYQ